MAPIIAPLRPDSRSPNAALRRLEVAAICVLVAGFIGIRLWNLTAFCLDSDEIFSLLKNGEVDAFALSRDQLNALSKKLPGTRVLDETFKQTVTAVAVPLNHPLSLEYASKFMTEAKTSGLLRKAFDNNGLKDTPLRAK